MKIKIQPSAVIISIILVWKFGVVAFLSASIAVFLHELCHAFISKERGYINQQIIFMPYGAVLYNKRNFDKLSNIIIAISGPICNFLLALLSASLFWLIPKSYDYLITFFYANLSIGFFNLLPLFPLDGGRVILALFDYKPKAQKWLKLITFISSIILIILYILSLKNSANYTLLTIGLFLILSVISENIENDYAYFLQRSPIIKNYNDGVIERVIYIDKNTSLRRVLLMMKPQFLCTFIILDGGKQVKKYSENDIQNIVSTHKLDNTFLEIILENHHDF